MMPLLLIPFFEMYAFGLWPKHTKVFLGRKP